MPSEGGGFAVRNHGCYCEEQICDLWPACDLTILTPQSTMGRSWWAECDPSDAEVLVSTEAIACTRVLLDTQNQYLTTAYLLVRVCVA